jgi:hypothetical protein
MSLSAQSATSVLYYKNFESILQSREDGEGNTSFGEQTCNDEELSI